MSEAMELQIEEAWVGLTRMSKGRRRTLYLTPSGRVVWRRADQFCLNLVEVGTYTRDIKLGILREDVFWTHGQMRGIPDAA